MSHLKHEQHSADKAPFTLSLPSEERSIRSPPASVQQAKQNASEYQLEMPPQKPLKSHLIIRFTAASLTCTERSSKLEKSSFPRFICYIKILWELFIKNLHHKMMTFGALGNK